MSTAPDVTTLLVAWRRGDATAFDLLFERLYADLWRRARRCLEDERAGHTLTPTALVHESYLKLVDLERVDWRDRGHFLAMASRVMRQILVSYARRHGAAKRGGGVSPVRLETVIELSGSAVATSAEELLALDVALERLEGISERLARTVELRYFGGLTVEETAEALDVAPSTVKLDWEKARAWLYRELSR